MPVHGLLNGINFIVTRRCPLECDHCVVEAGPWYQDHLTVEEMKAWLAEAAAFGMTKASFTGGDPLLYLDQVGEAVTFAHKLGMRTAVFTSGFWATSIDRGKAVLRRLEGLDSLGISTSSYHQGYVSLDRVINAATAADAVGISKVEIQIVGMKPALKKIKEEVESRLPPLSGEINIRRDNLFRSGRARNLTYPDEELFPVDQVDKRCPYPVLTVEPDGLVRGCCSSLNALKPPQHPFILGDLRAESTAQVFVRAINSAHYQTVRRRGLDPLLSCLRKDGMGDKIPDRVTNACDLCFQLYRQPEVARHLARRLSSTTGGAQKNNEVRVAVVDGETP